MNNIKIGTCSWKYDSWKGIVYSEQASINYLKEYSAHFDTVEIDQWFWSLFENQQVVLPRKSVVEEYARSVAEDFKFSIKVPNSITLTHYYKKGKDDPLITNPHFFSVDLFNRFLESLAPMGKKLGPLMFQFEYLNKQKMASQQQFLEQLGKFIEQCPKGFIYCVEIRNPNYLKKNYFQFLNDSNLSHVFLQGYYMPSIFEIYNQFADFIKGTTVIRLHGPDRSDMEKLTKKIWNQIIQPRENELDQLSKMLENLSQRNIDIYLNINNHYEGSAPLTIERIRERYHI